MGGQENNTGASGKRRVWKLLLLCWALPRCW
jgi:hypothetical protein